MTSLPPTGQMATMMLVRVPNLPPAASAGPDSAGRGQVWLRGHLPVGAAGARLHHGLGVSRVRVAAQIPVWSGAPTLQRSPLAHLCEYVCVFWATLDKNYNFS